MVAVGLLQMEVSLLVRNHKLQYDPPLEEIRLQHLTAHLQPFLALPLRMKGVSSLSEQAGFFGAIAHAYPAATAKVGCTGWLGQSARRVVGLFMPHPARFHQRCT